MNETTQWQYERIDDVPLLIELMKKLRWPELLDRHLGNHGHHQGLSNGWLCTVWVAYILSTGDPRKSTANEGVQGPRQMLERLSGQPIREGAFNDDRLGRLRRRLSQAGAWEALEADLWRARVEVYPVEVTGVRLDATTGCGQHTPHEGGVMQPNAHNKDHRPDLAHLKLRAAAAEPSGEWMVGNLEPGSRADDPLYLPLIRRVKQLWPQPGLLFSGDSKMAAQETRAQIVAQGDDDRVPLPMTGPTPEQFEGWVEQAVEGEQALTLIWQGERLLGAGYEFPRPLQAQVGAQEVTGSERVLLVRSASLVQQQEKGLRKRLEKAQAELRGLTPEPGRGKRQIRDEEQRQQAIEAVLTRHRVQGLVRVGWQRQEELVVRYARRGKPTPTPPRREEVRVRYQITQVQPDEAALARHRQRLGWRAYATSAAPARLSLAERVRHDRQGWCLERDFHLVKDHPLGLSPLFVWNDAQIRGKGHLLTLALRLLLVIETQVRRSLAQTGQVLSGLYPGQPQRTSDRPSGLRLLQAFSRAELTLIGWQQGDQVHRHLTPLSALHVKILEHLGLSVRAYTCLIENST